MLAGGRKISQTKLGSIQRYSGATHISSRYHLFGPIDSIRYELIVEAQGSNGEWIEMDFPYKIDHLTDRPPIVAPHHPRVDFRLWFERYPVRWTDAQASYPDVEAAPSVLRGYLRRLVLQLMNEPLLGLRHFSGDVDVGTDPLNIRITYYHYSMKPPGSDAYLVREKVGTVYFNSALESAKQKIIIKQAN